MANIIETLEQEEIARLGKKIPIFSPGDSVIVGVNVVEGTRKRVQIFEGVVISRRNRGLNMMELSSQSEYITEKELLK